MERVIYPKGSRIGISEKEQQELGNRYIATKDERKREYLLSPEHLERVCVGDVELDDKAYAKIIKYLKKECEDYGKED